MGEDGLDIESIGLLNREIVPKNSTFNPTELFNYQQVNKGDHIEYIDPTSGDILATRKAKEGKPGAPIFKSVSYDSSREDYLAENTDENVVLKDPTTGEIVSWIPRVEGGAIAGTINVPQPVQELLYNREQGHFAPFDANELSGIGQQLSAAKLPSAEATQMIALVTARVRLQLFVGAWSNARLNWQIMNEEERKKSMATFLIQAHIWSTTYRDDILKMPGVEEALAAIQAVPDYWRRDRHDNPLPLRDRRGAPTAAAARGNFMATNSPPMEELDAKTAWVLAEKLMMAGNGTEDALPPGITNTMDHGDNRLHKVLINDPAAIAEGLKQMYQVEGQILQSFIKSF